MANGVVEVELGGKIPFTVVGIWTTNVIRMEGEESLICSHSGRSRVEELHSEIKLIDMQMGGEKGDKRHQISAEIIGTHHIPLGVPLEAKLLGEIQKDVLDFFMG